MAHDSEDVDGISCFEAEQRSTVFSALSEYLSTGQYVDISLVCKGQVLRAVLSSSSKYFFRLQPGVNIRCRCSSAPTSGVSAASNPTWRSLRASLTTTLFWISSSISEC